MSTSKEYAVLDFEMIRSGVGPSLKEQAEEIISARKFAKRDQFSSMTIACLSRLMSRNLEVADFVQAKSLGIISTSEVHSLVAWKFLQDLDAFGLPGASPRLFTYATPNIVAFSILQELGKSGIAIGLSGGTSSLWYSLKSGIQILDSNRAEVVLLTGVEIIDKVATDLKIITDSQERFPEGEGVYCLVLAKLDLAVQRTPKFIIKDFKISHDETGIQNQTLDAGSDIFYLPTSSSSEQLKKSLSAHSPEKVVDIRPDIGVSSVSLAYQWSHFDSHNAKSAIFLEESSAGMQGFLKLEKPKD